MDLHILHICPRSFVAAGNLHNTIRGRCNLEGSGSHISTQSFDSAVLSGDRDLGKGIRIIYLKNS